MTHADDGSDLGPADDPWDAFEPDECGVESEPQYGDFWGELNDDFADGN